MKYRPRRRLVGLCKNIKNLNIIITARILVSIVSEQTLPNYLFIKELQNSLEINKYIFISTEGMEKKDKTNTLCQTANIDKKHRTKILVDENALFLSKKKLSHLNITNDDEIFVNLTGGTKMMSNATWQFFNNFRNVRFFYVPIGKNTYLEVFDEKPAIENQFNYQLSCQEYLNIYDIQYEKEKMLFTKEQVFDVYKDVKSTQFDLEKFPKSKLKKFNIDDYNIKQVHTKWYEEYLYYLIKEKLSLDDEKIEAGIKLFKKSENKENKFVPNDNEIDVFFLYNNNPFIVEAKFSIGGKEKINIEGLYNYLYKLAAINQRFGLKAKSTLITLATFENNGDNFKQNLEKRCRILNIHSPFDRQIIDNKQKFEEELKKFVS